MNPPNSVEVYRNLHNGMWSVKSRNQPNYGKVIDHADALILFDPAFVVSEPGRQRVLREQRKNVHAVVRGVRWQPAFDGNALLFRSADLRGVTYNPYKAGFFYDRETGAPVRSAEAAIFRRDGKVLYLP